MLSYFLHRLLHLFELREVVQVRGKRLLYLRCLLVVNLLPQVEGVLEDLILRVQPLHVRRVRCSHFPLFHRSFEDHIRAENAVEDAAPPMQLFLCMASLFVQILEIVLRVLIVHLYIRSFRSRRRRVLHSEV